MSRPASKGPLVGLEVLFAALHRVAHTLEELVASQKFEEDSIHFQEDYAAWDEQIFRQRNQLSGLKKLHTFSLPTVSLLGWRLDLETAWTSHWHEILPSSIRRVTLTDDFCSSLRFDDWTDDTMMPAITSLLD